MLFTSLGLSEPILKAITETGYTQPTPIQAKAIPLVLEGKDVLAAAQTGTGKTAGFTLPLLERMVQNHKPIGTHKGQPKRHIRALILTPTRELAAQIAENVEMYAKYLPYKSTVVFGGVNINRQINVMKQGIDILIATPGRLLDLCSQKVVDLSKVEILVLDEADRMLDMGFIHDMKKVVKLIPKNRQTLLFSATFSKEIKVLASGFQTNPNLVEVAAQNKTADRIAQLVHPVDKKKKKDLLVKLISDGQWKQVLVFTRTKHGANKLCEHLEQEGIKSAAIHGNKSQGARTKALANFKANSIRVLVATDIAARGIDIDMLPHVVNFELPNVAEDYVHRIGRTGRAGREGEAVSLVCVDENDYLRGIERLIAQKIPSIVVAGFEVDPSIVAEPINQGGGRGRRGGGGGQSRGNNNSGSRGSNNRGRSENSDKKSSNSRNRSRSRNRSTSRNNSSDS
ncbi:MAG: ATP-dependent RNA helicase RhlE [uncultured Sulfurovum sp.]|uniref:DEAD-box ATP-dependent RNA helicase RhpA n=1 Tax=uncultured Sulfurovum sp. TaxID=269237 RepID=A0A6S6T3X7_9BACT|nr:MAG: ATP-dependent RNA helicase RhlE [uncultured Sulfurovum sp.]